jgi:signal transduction histidine kinase
LIMASGSWAFYRLERANRLLHERTESLLEANQELALVSKTSAVGALSVHLLHEMKSQLFGLQSLLSGDAKDVNWRIAAETIMRLQHVVNQLVETIRNNQGAAQYEISLNEIAVLISAEAEPLAQAAGVKFSTVIRSSGTLSSRVANVVMIILMHLIQNAIQATSRHKSVTATLSAEENEVICEVQDEGAGISPPLQKRLFRPVFSSKEGGSGIGLALCKQLAHHLEAELVLSETGRGGSTFKLRIPHHAKEVKTTLAC